MDKRGYTVPNLGPTKGTLVVAYGEAWRIGPSKGNTTRCFVLRNAYNRCGIQSPVYRSRSVTLGKKR